MNSVQSKAAKIAELIAASPAHQTRVFMTKMIPPVPTSAVMLPTPKQKIGFSIDSIVGNDATAVVASGNAEHQQQQQPGSPQPDPRNGPGSPPQTPPAAGLTMLPATPTPPHHLMAPPQHHVLPPHMAPHPHVPAQPHPHPHLSPAQQHALHQHLLLQQQQQQHQGTPKSHHDIQELLQRLHHNAAVASSLSPLQTRLSPLGEVPSAPVAVSLKRERSPAPPGAEQRENPAQRIQPPHTPPKSVSPQSSQPSSSPTLLVSSPHNTPPQQQQQAPQQPPNYPKPGVMHPAGGAPGPNPLMLPGMPPAGLVRPFPMGPGGPPPPPQGQPGLPDIKALPPYINTPPELAPQHNPHLIAAAQFQMAAALQAGHVLGPAAAAAAAAGLPPHAAASFMGNPGMPRDSYPLYPWLLSRHGRIFPHRFPGSKYTPPLPS